MQILYVLLAVLGFGVLIFIHELGHFIAARLCHVTVYEFAIGMGPKLVWYESKKTGITYSLRMFPIGGYVSMAGEDDDSEDANALPKKRPWQRLIITAAGAVMNLLLGFLLIIAYVIATPAGSTTVAEISDKYEMSDAPLEDRLLIGDEIIKVGGTRVHIASELFYEISRKGIEPIDLTVNRNGQTVVLKDVVFPTFESEGQTFGDAFFRVAAIEKDVGTVLHQSFYSGVYMVKMVYTTLFDLLTGRFTVAAVSGPIGAAAAMSTVASQSLISFLYLLAAISINLGVFNLFPIPALDGFRILFILIEMVRRKPVPEKYERAINQAGLLVLLGLMLVIACKDIFQLFG